MHALLDVAGLAIRPKNNTKPILDNFHWSIKPGKVYALIGESGSGKSTLAFSLFGILPKDTRLSYESFNIFEKSYTYWEKEKWKSIRGKRIHMIPQNPHLVFHPFRQIGTQVFEYYATVLNKNISVQDCLSHWQNFGIRDPEGTFQSLPSQISGGEKQRITIAMAEFSQSELIIADEPTTSLDPIQEKNVIELLMNSLKTNKRSIVLITHNLKLMQRIADEVMVIKSGKIVEVNRRVDGHFQNWQTDYAMQLLDIL